MLEFIGYLLAVAVGISLGLIGGGGSILSVPILVYLFAIDFQTATTYSLFIVGIAALIGSYKHYKLGNLNIKQALIFGVPAIISMLLVRKFLLPAIPQEVFSFNNFILTKDILLMLIFAILMIVASISMIMKRKKNEQKVNTSMVKLVTLGFAVGMVTGLLGAGGGFLIIPALVFFAGLEMKRAIGTSLFIIAINTIIGFLGDVALGVEIDYKFLLAFTGLAAIGIFLGTYLSGKVNGAKLKPAFGWFVLVMGIYIITKEIFLK